MSGIKRIQAQRALYKKKGHSLVHDRIHQNGELVQAAIVFALPENFRNIIIWKWKLVDLIIPHSLENVRGEYKSLPWDIKLGQRNPGKSRKPDRIYDLTRAGALIAAEIDRLEWEEKHNG